MDMKTRLAAYALAVTLVAIDSAQAQSGNTVPVTADNFTRAESDMYFGNVVKQARVIRQQKITLGEMRKSGVRGLLVYCAD
jgi:hypothetical protein